MKKYWNQLLNLGTSPEDPDREIEKIRLINGILFTAITVHLIYLVPILVSGTKVLIVPNLMTLGGLLLPWVANMLRLVQIARWSFILITALLFVLKVLMLGWESGQQYVLLITALLPSMFFSRKWKVFLLFGISLAGFVGSYIYLLDHPAFTPYTTDFYFLANLITVFILLLLYIRYFQSEYLHYRQRLSRRNSELEATNRELKQFYYAVAHDLRSPVRGLHHLLEFMEEDSPENIPPDVLKHLDLMKLQIRRMENLTNGILDYSQISGKLHQKQELFLRRILTNLKKAIEKGSNHKLKIGNGIPDTLAATSLLSEVFFHLIDNSVKFHHEAAALIEVDGQLRDAEYVFVVRDNGPGIPEKYHQRVFRLFETLEPKSTSGNAGIGLAIAKKVVETHGGSIRIESDGATGTAVVFTLPVEG